MNEYRFVFVNKKKTSVLKYFFKAFK